MQKENEADFVEAKKLRKDEVLAAWKIRYELLLSLYHYLMTLIVVLSSVAYTVSFSLHFSCNCADII